MTPREERGLVIAATQKLTNKGPVWLVPSQSGKGKYTVCPDAEKPFCSCPDHEETGQRCKHIYAVEFTVKREVGGDGAVTETKTMTFTEKKVYRRTDEVLWTQAQMVEKHRFLELLFDLCKGVPDYPQPEVGRRHAPFCDQIFAMVYKVYSTFSSRRFACDLKDAHEKGYLSHLMHSVQVCAFLEDEKFTPVLQKLIVQSSLPLKSVETVFAPDSTGFSTSRFVRWFDEKYGTNRSGREWVKAHAICGVKTHIVTAVEILDKNAGDSPQFPSLVKTTAENFKIREVPADKGYLSNENLELVQQLGGTAYIPFKSNSTPGEAGSLWEKMFHYYNLHRADFEKHYHQRSNAESVFSMVKAKFRDDVRSRTDTAMKNEVLCKVLCHNICCLIMSQIELGIEPVFWTEEKAEAKQPEPIKEVVEQIAPVLATVVEVQSVEAKVEEAWVALRYAACVGA